MDTLEQAAIQRLCGALAIPTVSAAGTPPQLARFADLHAYLRRQYPLVHSKLENETVMEHSLFYRWPGGAGRPFALLAHLDVVPVESGTEDDWTHPPFAGVADDTTIWGRGANDVKCLVIAILEGVESLLAQGYTPDCDIYLCFGHNEEVLAGGPESGAAAMARLLESRNVRLRFVLDEGGAVITDSFMGLSVPIATIGIAEKGYCDFTLTAEGAGGHAAEPPNDTAVTNLSRLLLALKPAPPRLSATVEGTLKAIGKSKTGPLGFVLRHPRAFWPVLRPILLQNKQTAAMLRTTCVATQLAAGTQANVLPQSATATLNARILPGESKETLLNRVEEASRRLGITSYTSILRYSPPPRETPSQTETFARLGGLAKDIFGAVALPYMVTGCTDSREYTGVADEIYRFYPFSLTFEELDSMHSTNERLQCASFLKGITFITRFIQKSSGGKDGN
ncbi:M20/M25/M40 family metallo-hydrolase [Clostridia bacterium OttesenSCG-928-O13]|nr:M20/M25/M40 family metallo-hydrolase [Clostridia bacterium OttesenSCG-928-O13]